MNKNFIIILVAIVIVFVGIVVFSKFTQPPGETSNGSSNYYGNMESPVELTEFVDFQCEACYAYYPTVKQIKEKYKDTVKFRVRYFPIASSHQFARLAASYAEAAAKQGKFWEMHDKIFEGQKTWENTKDPSTYFDTYAQEVGLDMAKLKEDQPSTLTSATINADLKEVNRLGGDGTPTFVLNGKKIDNPDNSIEAISKVLDEALRQAQSQESN